MIDIRRDRLMSIREIADWLEENQGRRVSRSTVEYWAKSGLRSADGQKVKLETLRFGKSRCTSLEALQRFFEAVDGKSPRRKTPPRGHAVACRKLDEAGIGP